MDNVTAVEGVAGYFTALGLSTAAGLNAYIPILSVGLLSRYTDLIDLPAPWDALGDPIVLGIVTAVLAVIVLVAVVLVWRKLRQLGSRFRARDRAGPVPGARRLRADERATDRAETDPQLPADG